MRIPSRLANWLENNGISLVVAGAGLMGVWLGGWLTAHNDEGLWRKQIIRESNLSLVNKRVSIIGEIVRLHVEAQRMALLMDSPVMTATTLKEISEIQGQYFQTITLTSMYFCEKTQRYLEKMTVENDGKDWWTYERSVQDELVEIMRSELSCDIQLDSTFR